MFVWGFDKTKTSLDDLIEFFEKGFQNVVNIRRRTIPSIENPKVCHKYLRTKYLHIQIISLK